MNNIKVSDDLYLAKAKHVYVLLANDGSVKIGVSNNVEFRMYVLENYTGKKIVDYYYTPACSNPFVIERQSHIYFMENNIYGEWFNIDYKEACDYVKEMYNNLAICVYGSKKKDRENIDKTYKEMGITKDYGKDMNITEIKDKLMEYVNKGLLSHIPETYEETLSMICEQNILYYTRLKENLYY